MIWLIAFSTIALISAIGLVAVAVCTNPELRDDDIPDPDQFSGERAARWGSHAAAEDAE